MDKRIISRVKSRSVLRKISDLEESNFFSGRRSEPGDVAGPVDPDDVFLVGQNAELELELVDAGNLLHRLNAGLVVDVDDALVQKIWKLNLINWKSSRVLEKRRQPEVIFHSPKQQIDHFGFCIPNLTWLVLT